MDTKELVDSFTANIEALPIGTITVATVLGPQEAGALLLGDWALNENNQGWTVTHQRTGYAGKSYPTPIEALILLGIYLGAGLRIPDEATAETISVEFKRIPWIADVATRVKGAIAMLDSWDLDLDYNEKEVDP